MVMNGNSTMCAGERQDTGVYRVRCLDTSDDHLPVIAEETGAADKEAVYQICKSICPGRG